MNFNETIFWHWKTMDSLLKLHYPTLGALGAFLVIAYYATKYFASSITPVLPFPVAHAEPGNVTAALAESMRKVRTLDTAEAGSILLTILLVAERTIRRPDGALTMGNPATLPHHRNQESAGGESVVQENVIRPFPGAVHWPRSDQIDCCH